MNTILRPNRLWLAEHGIADFFTVAQKELSIKETQIQLVEGSIIDLDVDAIVNPANPYLQLCSGIAGAIRTHGGLTIQLECDQIGYYPVGGAVITNGGELKARHIIHAVGPIWTDPKACEKLASATRASLALADEYGLKVIAFPALITETCGCPLDKCARIMLSTVVDYLFTENSGIEQIIFCLGNEAMIAIFEEKLEAYMA